jgi:hypothetical protein
MDLKDYFNKKYSFLDNELNKYILEDLNIDNITENDSPINQKNKSENFLNNCFDFLKTNLNIETFQTNNKKIYIILIIILIIILLFVNIFFSDNNKIYENNILEIRHLHKIVN